EVGKNKHSSMSKKILDIYSDYLICQNKYATATGLSDLLSEYISNIFLDILECLFFPTSTTLLLILSILRKVSN
ncbi:MAG: hypothetical protein ACRY3E_03440, partial [Candidatus Lariskella arthropodorum]